MTRTRLGMCFSREKPALAEVVEDLQRDPELRDQPFEVYNDALAVLRGPGFEVTLRASDVVAELREVQHRLDQLRDQVRDAEAVVTVEFAVAEGYRGATYGIGANGVQVPWQAVAVLERLNLRRDVLVYDAFAREIYPRE